MSTDTCNQLVAEAISRFQGENGLNQQLPSLSGPYPLPSIATFVRFSGALDIYEKAESIRYPVAAIYCSGLKNTQREKFRTLSGTASLVLEIRVSGAKAEELETVLNSYVEAACVVLTASRGSWASFGSYSGDYAITFQSIRAGGKHFVKSAKIEFDIHVSK